MNWNEKAQRALRETEDDLPESVRQRLGEARRAAVSAAADTADSKSWAPFLGALASAALIVVLVMPRSATQSLPLLEDTEMAAAQEVELLEELEFVAWMLAEENDHAFQGQG